MIPRLTSGQQERSSLITPLTSRRKIGSTPCEVNTGEKECEMRSYGSDTAMTGICYDGFYQDRIEKNQVWNHFLPTRSLGPATPTQGMLQSRLLPTSHSWTTIGVAIVSGRVNKDAMVGADLPKQNGIRCMTCGIIGSASPRSSFGWAARMPAIQQTSLRTSKRLPGSMPTCGRYTYSRPSSSCAYTLRGLGSVLPIGQHRDSLAVMRSLSKHVVLNSTST